MVSKVRLVYVNHLFQATSNYDDIFDCFLKQVEIDEFSRMTSDDLRICLIEYCQHNIVLLEVRSV